MTHKMLTVIANYRYSESTHILDDGESVFVTGTTEQNLGEEKQGNHFPNPESAVPLDT